jgi:arylsulfatase A-like enzyme
MTRRGLFVATVLAGVLALVGATLWPWSKARPARTPRNLVLVVFDTLRADRMSLYGNQRETTPYLDSHAGEMLRFARVEATAPWTVPSHASIFTGLRPAQHKAQWGRMVLADRFETLAEVLAAHGFLTVGLSSNLFVVPETGLDQGFEKFELLRGSWETKTERILGELPGIFDRAREKKSPLFLFVNLMDTHLPYNISRYGKAFGVEPPLPVDNAEIKWQISAGKRPFNAADKEKQRAAYDAAVRYVDDTARDIVAALKAAKMLEQTLVVFTSDHGDGLGYHRALGHSISVWEEQLNVPLVMRFPDGWRGGDVVKGRTTLLALAPSLLDWLDIERPAVLRGAPDLEEAVKGPICADYRSYFSEMDREMNTQMANTYPELAASTPHRHVLYCGRYKLIVDSHSGVSFFNLRKDPNEQHDLASTGKRDLTRCASTYRALVRQGVYTPFSERVSDAELKEVQKRLPSKVLRSLGYVQ